MINEIVNRINITKHLIEYELEMVGKTLVDVIDDDRWQFNFPMTRNQHEQYYSYVIPLLRKTFKCNKRKAESIFKWYYKTFGLRIKN
jgi:hypothetical protein